jgi:ElaB/YqjD/DUF883 family membrane-anchored ribosome-binding protein
MADDTKKHGEPDRSRINLREDYEVRYWCKKLNVSPKQLRHLIAEHGNSVTKIRAALSTRHPRWATIALAAAVALVIGTMLSAKRT